MLLTNVLTLCSASRKVLTFVLNAYSAASSLEILLGTLLTLSTN